MYHRLAEEKVRIALSNRPVVLITGPRQAGKTTLALELCNSAYEYVTMDDEPELKRAKEDPVGFIREMDKTVIDEVQRVPELFRTIKKSVDEDRRPGRFLLIGSSNILLNSRMSDNMVGRMQQLNLLPLSQTEILGNKTTFLDRLFSGDFENGNSDFLGDKLLRMVISGGFPETIDMDEQIRGTWTRDYMNLILKRDLRDIANVEKVASFPKLAKILALHSGKQINYSQIASNIGISYHTVQQYTAILEQLYLIATISPWYTNLLSRISKRPKIHFLDSGLLSSFSGLSFDLLKRDRDKFGHMLESFVFSEILKLMEVSEMWLTPYHFQKNTRNKVDIVLERNDGMIAGIEVKASATILPKDFSGLRVLSDVTGEMFAHGIVLYDGTKCMSYGEKLTAVPISSLWT